MSEEVLGPDVEALGLPQDPGPFPERSTTPVFVAEYDPRWPGLFEQERERIRAALDGRLLRLEHVGSTAVPGLASKPVLDMAGTVRVLDDVGVCLDALAALGYVYVPEFEADLPNRRYFRKDARPLHRTHHLHLYADGDPDFTDYLLFRDSLRADAEVRRRYEELKRELARSKGRAEYTASKGPFIRSVLDRARDAGGRRP